MKKEKDNMYSERSMVLYKVTFNERNSPDEALPIHDIDGLSCVELFYQFVDAKKDELISLRGGNKFIKISACEQVEDTALIKVTSGSSGENVDVVDVDSGDTEYTYGTDKAAMIDSRCLVSQLSGTSYAFLCVEHTRNGAGDTSLFDPFRSFLRDKAPKAVVRFEPLIEPEVLENFISVEMLRSKNISKQGIRWICSFRKRLLELRSLRTNEVGRFLWICTGSWLTQKERLPRLSLVLMNAPLMKKASRFQLPSSIGLA